MKRHGNLYPKIYDLNNLQLADQIARKGKLKQPGVIRHDRNAEANLLDLQQQLINKTYRIDGYTHITIREPKVREISKLEYFPHRIVQHAIMNIVQRLFVAMFTADTYSCIPGKGIHAAERAVKRALRDKPGTEYCVKLDVRKFYPSVKHPIIKQILRRIIKDNDLLWLLDVIIDSAPGLPIGNYTSQYFANLYMTGFDHWIKEQLRVKYYFRYADDIVILAPAKPYLHALLADIRNYFTDKLQLEIKDDYQVFPVAARGINFVGYKFYHTHTLLRPSIKKSFAREVAGKKDPAAIAGYMGWAKHCNSKHLVKKLLA